MDISKKEFKKICEMQIKMQVAYCYICGKLITKPKDFTLDHEPPKSRQKELGESQLYPCCKKCNHQKGALTLQEYMQWLVLEQKRNGLQK